MSEFAIATLPPQPRVATAVLVLEDGHVFWGQGVGATGNAVGEVCFNTSMSGYQEIITDPSYAGQIINFTFPHIGNVGCNLVDVESRQPAARGVIMREVITPPSNWRSEISFDEWLTQKNLIGIAGIDSRALTARIRDKGAPNGVIAHQADGKFDLAALLQQAQEWSGLNGLDLAAAVTCDETYEWNQGLWEKPLPEKRPFHVVAIDYGAKHNILRCLVQEGCRVTVVPANTPATVILGLQPDGVFLSNGPGDPAATGMYAVPIIQALLAANLPIFGICLGHQLLALALGAKTGKMRLGHRGGNHPVKDIKTGKVEITSQNHGFMVLPETLPATVEITHISLFDGSNEGIAVKNKPVFSVQYHPEASPGPEDAHYLFKRFIDYMQEATTKS
ncbi:MAG: glutamine-hydrolyzing carbamoyl-phosphate synthase small subunit [Alphaproteobacteria bacterium]